MRRYALLGALGLALGAGCASPFTYENYLLVKIGDSQDQVVSIIGNPVQQSEPSPMVFQAQEDLIVAGKKDKYTIESYVYLDEDMKVVAKEFYADGKTEDQIEVPGGRPPFPRFETTP